MPPRQTTIFAQHLTCPLTKMIFAQPVMASCGDTFEYLALKAHLNTEGAKCPIASCNCTLTATTTFNRVVYAITTEYLNQFPEALAQVYLTQSLLKYLIENSIDFDFIKILQAKKDAVLARYASSALHARALKKGNQKDFNGAIADLSSAITLSPNHSNFYFERAWYKTHNNDFEGACNDAAQAIKLGSKNSATVILHATAFNQLMANQFDNQDLLYFYGTDKFNPEESVKRNISQQMQQQYELIASNLSLSIEAEPKNINLMYQLAVLNLRVLDFKNAMQMLDRIIAVEQPIVTNQNFSNAYMRRASCKRLFNDVASALIDSQQVIKFYPKNSYAHLIIACIKRDLGDLNAALSACYNALELATTPLQKSFALANLGITFDMTGNYNKALENYSKAIETLPSLNCIYYLRAKTKAKLRDYAGAMLDLDLAIELWPENVAALIKRAELFLEFNKLAEAARDVEQAKKFAAPARSIQQKITELQNNIAAKSQALEVESAKRKSLDDVTVKREETTSDAESQVTFFQAKRSRGEQSASSTNIPTAGKR